MRMLAIAALAAATMSSAGFAQADPAAPVAATSTTQVHTHTVTHNDGKKHPQIHRVVHRSTVATPNGVATRTTTATTKTTPQ